MPILPLFEFLFFCYGASSWVHVYALIYDYVCVSLCGYQFFGGFALHWGYNVGNIFSLYILYGFVDNFMIYI